MAVNHFEFVDQRDVDSAEISRSRKAFGRELGLDGLAFDVFDVALSPDSENPL